MIAAITANTYAIPYAWKKNGPTLNPFADGLGMNDSGITLTSNRGTTRSVMVASTASRLNGASSWAAR